MAQLQGCKKGVYMAMSKNKKYIGIKEKVKRYIIR
jgi:hypothetical protein